MKDIETKDALINSEHKMKCFVIMPISDNPDYPDGHFLRVYNEIIKPAVIEAGFEPERADDSSNTKVIILSILKSITEYEMAICDLSSLNPNVLYELGVRQMAKKPVTLIKDERTKRIFDIGLMSDIQYDSSLRVDLVRTAKEKITESIVTTYAQRNSSSNSLLDQLGVNVQVSEKTVEVSATEKYILDQLSRIENRLEVNSLSSYNRLVERINTSESSLKDYFGKPIYVGSILSEPDIDEKGELRKRTGTYYVVKSISTPPETDIHKVSFTVFNCKIESVEEYFVTNRKINLELIDLANFQKQSPKQFKNYMNYISTSK